VADPPGVLATVATARGVPVAVLMIAAVGIVVTTFVLIGDAVPGAVEFIATVAAGEPAPFPFAPVPF
jgi:hypothetical protein